MPRQRDFALVPELSDNDPASEEEENDAIPTRSCVAALDEIAVVPPATVPDEALPRPVKMRQTELPPSVTSGMGNERPVMRPEGLPSQVPAAHKPHAAGTMEEPAAPLSKRPRPQPQSGTSVFVPVNGTQPLGDAGRDLPTFTRGKPPAADPLGPPPAGPGASRCDAGIPTTMFLWALFFLCSRKPIRSSLAEL